MESGHESEICKHLKTYPGAKVEEGDISTPGVEVDSPSSSSSSSSSSDTSLVEFFRVDGSQSTISNAGIADPPIFHEDVQLAPKDDEKDVGGDQYPKSGESSNQGSPTDAIPMEVTVISPESSLGSLPATQSPQIQVMGRSGEPDPYRIPSSVFARSKSTTPMEWSVTSNESLFSIHVGNNSFSKDHIFLMGRSGELGMSGELLNFQGSRPPDNLVRDGDRKTSTLGEDTEKSTELGGGLCVAEAAAETVKEVLRAVAEDRSKQKILPAEGIRQSLSHSHRSDGSGTSIRSFAFPLKKRCVRPFCYCRWPLYCCNGSWAFCSCTWAFCYYCNSSWTCCHCCKCNQASCHCCNCKRVSTCSCVSSTLTGEGGRSSDFAKLDSEQKSQKQPEPEPQSQPQPEPQPQTPVSTPSAAGGKWFPCFSCCCPCCS